MRLKQKKEILRLAQKNRRKKKKRGKTQMIADRVDEPLVAEGVLADEEAQVDDEAAVAEGTGADDFYAGA